MLSRYSLFVLAFIAFAFGLSAQPVITVTSNVNAPQNYEVLVPITVRDFNSISEYNATLTWDETVIEYQFSQNVYPGFLLSLSGGELNFRYNGPSLSLPDSTVLFRARFMASGSVGSSCYLRLSINSISTAEYDVSVGLLTITAPPPPITFQADSVSGPPFSERVVNVRVFNADSATFTVNLWWDSNVFWLNSSPADNIEVEYWGGNSLQFFPNQVGAVFPDSTILLSPEFNLGDRPGTETPLTFTLSSAYIHSGGDYLATTNVLFLPGSILVTDTSAMLLTEFHEAPTIEVFPNPVASEVRCSISSNHEKIVQLEIISDQKGLLEEHSFHLKKGLNELVIPSGHWPKGTYLLRASGHSGLSTVKRIVKK